MGPQLRVAARALVVGSVLAAALFVGVLPQASAVTSHRPLNDTRPVTAAPVEVGFPIEYFGVVADLDGPSAHLPERGRTPYGEARFRVRGHWTAWRVLDHDGVQQPGHFTGSLVSVDRADAYQVRGLPAAGHRWRAAAINTTDGPTVVVGHRPAGTADAAPSCMSRADWGADESISGWAHGDKQTFFPVQVLTVHHTAGSNDPTQDYAATVRAIYSFHVQTNKWADIGYQYLVDGHGTVYEGRSTGHTSRSCRYGGGDGSDFAHDPVTDGVVTGAQTEGSNSGNLGIALMGCYEPAAAICTGDTTPPAPAVDALENELALLAARHDLDPEGTVSYVNPSSGAQRTVATISGHRDWNGTECPGANLYALLPEIRDNVASRAVVAFQQRSRTVQENAGRVLLTLTRHGNTSIPATVGFARSSGTAGDTDATLTPGTVTFAAGETTRTIAVTVRNDATPEPAETVGVALSTPGGSTVVGYPAATTLTVAASDQRPDALVSTAASSGYVGNNVYNTSGDRQARALTARRTQVRTFYVRVANDGTVRNAFAVRGSAARSGSQVRYLARGRNITTAMRSAKGWRVTLPPRAFTLVKVQVTVLRTASRGSLKPATVRATWSGDGTREDLVRTTVKVIR